MKRVLILLLALLMLLSVTAFAEELSATPTDLEAIGSDEAAADEEPAQAGGLYVDGVLLPSKSKLSLDISDVVTYRGGLELIKVKVGSSKVLQAEQPSAYELRLTPKKTGTSKLTLTWADGSRTVYTVVISDRTVATGITLSDQGTVLLSLYDTYQAQCTLTPATAVSAVSYKVSSSSLASVSADGLVTPLKTGTVTLTATANRKKATVKLKIYDPYPPRSISLDQGSALSLSVGDELQLTTRLQPDTARARLTWKSSKASVVSVTGDGRITALKEGTATITVTTHNKKKATIKVTVSDPYKVKSLRLNYSGTISWPSTEPLTLTWTAETYGGDAYPVRASDMTWSTSNKRVATIDADGNVTVNKAGTVTFTLKASGSKAKATVRFKFILTAPLRSLGISPGTVSVFIDDTQQLKPVFTPSNAELLTDLQWVSGDPSIATVDENGLLTGHAAGMTVIRVIDTKTEIYASVFVKVTYPPQYRALLCVEPTTVSSTVNGIDCTGYYGRETDLASMVAMLGKQNYGGRRYSIDSLYRSSAQTVLTKLSAIANVAHENDVTLFFFMGHGNQDGTLCFYDGSTLPISTLKGALDAIEGKVIVLLGSCYSGSTIARDLSSASPSAFNRSVINTFNSGDRVRSLIQMADGEVQPVTDALLDSLDPTGEVPRTGELLT